VLLSQSSVVF